MLWRESLVSNFSHQSEALGITARAFNKNRQGKDQIEPCAFDILV